MAQNFFLKLSSIVTTCLFFSFSLIAQSTCIYQLQLVDSFGDGWDDSFISVILNGEATTYTLGDGDDDETTQSIAIEVMTGDTLLLRYGTDGTPTFQNEISYRLVDADGLIVIAAGPNPQAGLVLEQEIICPKCPILNDGSVRIIEVTATTAAVFWGIEEGEQVVVELGEMGFEQGTGMQRIFATGTTTLDNLAENTNYDIYLSRICANGEQSRGIGPFSFKTSFLSPPDTCFYSLRMLDFFGDGWNGSSISITVNDVVTEYTLLDGSVEVMSVPALKDLPFQLAFNGGFFDEEISYVLLDPMGNNVFTDGPLPETGNILNFIACPSCPSPVNPIVNPAAETAEVSWEELPEVDAYLLEYGLQGFELGEGLEVISTQPNGRFTNLKENTTYEYYLNSNCGDSTANLQLLGPFSFTTLFKKDVGIQQITMPTTRCGLGVSEMIEIELKNYGADPQSLITYRFSVNGVEGGVPVPTDGFYTGIISKDSSTTIQFDTPTDLMQAGVYEIAVWTELEGDSNSSNDTTIVSISNIPTITNFPYSQNFSIDNGGWTVAANSENASWEFGIPQSEDLSRAFSGTSVWATNLTGAANEAEVSYLLSPCMDFSSLSEDPTIGCRFFMDAPEFSDIKAGLEVSVNGGRWQSVGERGEGFNWYNNDTQTAWIEDASLGSWLYAEQTLMGTAGSEDVRLRFVFDSEEESEIGFGFAVDDIHIFQKSATNAVARVTANVAQDGCGSVEDQVTILVRNSGTDSIQQLQVGYRINEESIVTEQVDILIVPGASMTYTFSTPFNSETIQSYRIQSWVTLAGDATPISDTTYAYFEVLPPNPLPLIENFDDEQVDDGWLIVQGEPGFTEAFSHNNETIIISDNMWFGNPFSEFVTATYGPINEGDSLTFSYRLADWPDADTPLELTEDTLTISVSTDCGATFTPIYSVHQDNHIPTTEFTTVAVPLTNYVGVGLSFSFKMKWGNGDYWFDIDDITILSCPASLALTAEVVEATGEEMNDGSIRIAPLQGSGIYSYDWTNLEVNTDSINGLLPGSYQVIVTDTLLGCQDSLTVEVGILATSTEDIAILEELVIYPNPTAHSAQLDMSLKLREAATIHIYNIVGQPIKTIYTTPSLRITKDLELGDLPKGIYWIRIAIGEAFTTRKIFKIY